MTKKIKSTSCHQYSEVETTWISLIGWHHKISNKYVCSIELYTYSNKHIKELVTSQMCPAYPGFEVEQNEDERREKKSCEMRVVYVTYPHLLMQSSAVILFPAIWDPSRDSSWLQKNLICKKKNKEKGRLVKNYKSIIFEVKWFIGKNGWRKFE